MCSGYPTQIAIAATLGAFGITPQDSKGLSPTFVFAVTAIDTVLLLGLVFLFLRASGDSARLVLLGQRSLFREAMFGLKIVPLVFLIVLAAQLIVRAVAPFLRNVENNPFAAFLATPWLLAALILLVLVGGGVREEVQRGFLLHRFGQRLGGAWVGVAVTSLSFGLGHTLQGWDAALITGGLGALWGAIYVVRRSVVGTVTSHAVFNVAQIAVGYAALNRGG